VFYEVPVHSPEQPARKRSRLPAVAGAAAVLSVVVAASALGERADVMGKTKRTPKPNCPGTSCEVNGQVTGFQRSVDGEKGLFRARKNGRIVAWGVDLSKPSKSERNFFGKLSATNAFGEKPTAGISILSRAGNERYRLVRKSPIMAMNNYYGESPIITLRDPLRIKKGQVVALTTISWLPNFAASIEGGRRISRKNAWLGSRTHKDFPRPANGGKKSCAIPPNVPDDRAAKYFFNHSSPQKKVGSERKYGCEYTGARLMYYAYFQPNRSGGS
jgi:hypothetical protein